MPTPPPPDKDVLSLDAAYVGASEVWLSIKSLDGQSAGLLLRRDNQVILQITSVPPETLVIDTGLTPAENYEYSARRLIGGEERELPSTASVNTLMTSSHVINWQVDTLGARGAILDLWAFSETDIWAVGEIFVEDQLGNELLYNCARWNGMQWSLIRIPYMHLSQSVYSEIRTIHAFNSNDIWFATANLIHWNGQSFESHQLPPGVWGPYLSNQAWGHEGVLYSVGDSGAIARRDAGGNWERMISGTYVKLEDIWGLNNDLVWATGTNVEDGLSVMLEFRQGAWKSIFESSSVSPYYGFSSVWSNQDGVIHAVGNSRMRRIHVQSGTIVNSGIPQGYVAHRVRGNSNADVFVTGQGGEVMHYNGSSWVVYDELSSTEGFTNRWLDIVPKDQFIVVAGGSFTGLTTLPIVARGVR